MRARRALIGALLACCRATDRRVVTVEMFVDGELRGVNASADDDRDALARAFCAAYAIESEHCPWIVAAELAESGAAAAEGARRAEHAAGVLALLRGRDLDAEFAAVDAQRKAAVGAPADVSGWRSTVKMPLASGLAGDPRLLTRLVSCAGPPSGLQRRALAAVGGKWSPAERSMRRRQRQHSQCL